MSEEIPASERKLWNLTQEQYYAELTLLRAKVERLSARLGHLHGASMDAFNFIGGANPPISKDDLIETLKEEMSKARKELNE